jgi:hypothetical protein
VSSNGPATAGQANTTKAADPEPGRAPRLPMRLGILLASGSAASVIAGWWLFAKYLPPGVNLVRLQWAGSSAAATRVVGDSTAQYRLGLGWDLWALVPGFTLGLLGACYLGWKIFLTTRTRGWAKVGLAATVGAFAFNLAQDMLLLFVLYHGLRGAWIFRAAQAMSFAKFAVLLVAALVGLIALATTAGRLITHHWVSENYKAVKDSNVADRPAVIPPPPVEEDPATDDPGLPGPDYSWWCERPGGPHPHWAQGFAQPAGTTTGGTGICVSGGGIRSAAVSLGALQALQKAKILTEADHLVSVSGGGYMVGGLQLARVPDGGWPPAESAPAARTAENVFGPGSVEEDHLRRHSSYISAGARQWASALGVLFRGVASSFVVIGLTVTTAGLAIAAFFHTVPALEGGMLGKLKPYFLAPHQGRPPFPAIATGVWLAVAGAAALATLGYLTFAWIPGSAKAGRPGQATSRMSAWLVGLAVLLAAIGIALPALIWTSSWLTWKLKPADGVVITAGTLNLVLSYFGAIAATLWRKRSTLLKPAKSGTGTGVTVPVRQVLPDSMIQMVLVWLCLIVLILAALLLCSWIATSGLDRSWWALAPPAALAVIAIFLDQTAVSLHPFYRQRLASAFAVRRAGAGGCEVAVPYPYAELTKLTSYASRAPQFPGVVFAATANIKGQHRTPSGRPAASFTFTGDYVGGPRVGWIRTDFLQQIAARRIQRDLTVEAAMAISGAAFASAMGASSRFFEVFLALSNARLGAWLPNPYFVALKAQHPDDWTVPGLPRMRRLSYFVREIFGIYPSTGRMLLCTDGGHFENLGLVEILRHRCERVICIDASGAKPPLDDTLAGAITLALEELGVKIKFRDPAFDLVAGGWNLLEPAEPFTDLNNRLSKNAVIVGDITYPPVENLPECHGKLIFAQAVLTAKMSYQLLDFPQDDPYFPRDGTADQWFDVSQFDAYQQLGQAIGTWAADRA